jgi:hypothetical protein
MTPSSSTPFWTEEDIISRYTRADGLRDGTLVAAPVNLTRDAGISIPVAMTRAVWAGYVSPYYLAQLRDQDETGRLWDLLWMLRMAAVNTRGASIIHFKVIFALMQNRAGRNGQYLRRETQTITFKAVCGPGDDGEPVITIMLPGED